MQSVDQRHDGQRAAKEAVLDLFAAATKIPITLYEFPNGIDGEPIIIISTESRGRFAEHCRVIQRHDGGAACREDQVERAKRVFASGRPELLCCHAGLYNEVAPILGEDNKPRAVVSYGEVRLVGEVYEKHSLYRHRQAVTHMQLPVLQADRLRQLQLEAPAYTKEEFEGFRDVLRTTIRLLYALIDQDEQMRRRADHLSHEIQTPIQDVLAKADNLLTLWPALTMDEPQRLKAGLPLVTLDDLKRRLIGVWDAAVRLRTVAQTITLGTYMADYRFEEISLLPLLDEARSHYVAEAANRHIEIEIRINQEGEPPVIECSREHLQLALNNLMHNAVKYSFSGTEDRRRFVRVEGRFVGDYFELTFANYGIGILPQEIQSGKIFEDGYQGKLRQGEFRTGSGKGLHFVKSIVERHHGSVHIKSDIRAEDPTMEKAPYLTRLTVKLPRTQSREESAHAKDYRLGG